MVQSTVDHVVQESSDLFSNIVSTLKIKTEQLLDSKGINRNDAERQELIQTFANFQHPFENLDTAYQQQKYFTESVFFINPLEIPFAVAY